MLRLPQSETAPSCSKNGFGRAGKKKDRASPDGRRLEREVACESNGNFVLVYASAMVNRFTVVSP